mmetsp:Transcript_10899/g.30605  ORF Transcript_10899/g.30605 Transcript_10899/m.30605 type:complete len:205 (+) Transcript_10899:508-1122(+)
MLMLWEHTLSLPGSAPRMERNGCRREKNEAARSTSASFSRRAPTCSRWLCHHASALAATSRTTAPIDSASRGGSPCSGKMACSGGSRPSHWRQKTHSMVRQNELNVPCVGSPTPWHLAQSFTTVLRCWRRSSRFPSSARTSDLKLDSTPPTEMSTSMPVLRSTYLMIGHLAWSTVNTRPWLKGPPFRFFLLSNFTTSFRSCALT